MLYNIIVFGQPPICACNASAYARVSPVSILITTLCYTTHTPVGFSSMAHTDISIDRAASRRILMYTMHTIGRPYADAQHGQCTLICICVWAFVWWSVCVGFDFQPALTGITVFEIRLLLISGIKSTLSTRTHNSNSIHEPENINCIPKQLINETKTNGSHMILWVHTIRRTIKNIFGAHY